jgi:CheY-like chemotaxis protein
MGQVGAEDVIRRYPEASMPEDQTISGRHSVLVVRDADRNSEYLESVCGFLDIGVRHATTADDLRTMLTSVRPVAVIADLDGEGQDGFHVMKIAADYDRSVPILLLTGYDPALLGAIDAVQEIWGLTRVGTAAVSAGIGAWVDFICHAARDAGRPRMARA